MITATYTGKDQNFQDEQTIYWFEIDGTDCEAEKIFNSEIFGIVDCNGNKSVIYADGYPVQNKYVEMIVLSECKITDEMIGE